MSREPRDRRGAVLVLIIVGLTSLLLFVGLAIDVGYWYQRRAWVQSTADLSVMAGLNSVDANDSAADQATHAVAVAKGLITANGFDINEWNFVTTQKTSSGVTYCDTLSTSHSSTVPTFFWRIFSNASPTMVTRATAEGALTTKIFPPCGVIALNTSGSGQGFDSRGGGKGVYDSYNSNVGGYNGNNDLSPFSHHGNNQGICANGGIGMGGNSKLGGSELAEGAVEAPGQHDPPAGQTSAEALQGNGPHFTFEGFFTPQYIKDYVAQGAKASVNNPSGYGKSTASDPSRPLEPGKTYYFTDISGGITMQSCNSCSPSNVTSIYWNGNYSAGGGIDINKNGCAPTCLQIYGLANAGTFSTKGGQSTIVANFVIPTYLFDMRGNGEFFGAVIADLITLKGTVDFHFDEALGNRYFSQPPKKIKVHLKE